MRPRDVQQAMMDINPQIVHFSEHGTRDKGLVLENEAGQPSWLAEKLWRGYFDYLTM